MLKKLLIKLGILEDSNKAFEDFVARVSANTEPADIPHVKVKKAVKKSTKKAAPAKKKAKKATKKAK